MPAPRSLATWLILLGLGIALVGGLLSTGLFNWFGRLPGDIRIESGNTRVFIPLVSCVVVSLVLSALLYLLRKVLHQVL